MQHSSANKTTLLHSFTHKEQEVLPTGQTLSNSLIVFRGLSEREREGGREGGRGRGREEKGRGREVRRWRGREVERGRGKR